MAAGTGERASRFVAVDVGGTFIDLVSLDRGTGQVSIEKQPAIPEGLAEGIVEALERLPGTPSELERFIHGTTIAMNALVQRAGARVGLITTRGFRDVLELGRGNRPHVYDWVWVPPEPLVPRNLRREVTERTGPRGEEIAPLDLAELTLEVDALVADGVEAIAVCFLHAYANADHERAAAHLISQRHPRMPVTCSSDVAAEWHEFERTSTAVINAYLQPSFGGYVRSMRSWLAEVGLTCPVGVMQSNGGLMAAERAVQLPARTLASGPTGGVIGAAALASHLGHDDVICTDVGGTTYDVSIIEGGRIQERTEADVSGFPVLSPTVDVVSIGAGGGSVAWFDDLGSLRVGPMSAGARPGPACFGLGGVEPTVTDCHLILGRLDAERFLGSRMRLDPNAAVRAVQERVAAPLGMDLESASAGVLKIAETAMANAIHSVTVERGLDPRLFVLYAYGGGGGLFATPVADELDIRSVVVPRAPANFSAWGMLAAPHREDASTTRVRPLTDEVMRAIVADLESLRADVVARLMAFGHDEDEVLIERRADLRFHGQEHVVTVRLDADRDRDDAKRLAGRFVDRHRRLYGHGDPRAEIEVVTVRCEGHVPTEEPRWPTWSIQDPAMPRIEREVYFEQAGGRVPTAVYAREELAVGQRVLGPAVIEEWTSTVMVPPGWVAETEAFGALLLNREAS